MATLIGIVSKVIGQVFAVANDGTRRALIEGDRLFAGDQLVTGAEGAVAVHLQNGQELTLGRGSSLQMNAQLLAHQTPHVDTAEAVTPSQAQLTDVEQLQKAIAAGADPTQTGEATAAGPAATGAPGGALGGGHSVVLLEEVGGRIDPTIGFPTAGFGGIPEFPEERHNADINDNTPAAAPVVDVLPPPPVNNPVTLGGLNATDGELTLNEANLPDGSASNPSALTQSGTFTVTAPDGLLSLNVGGISVISGGVAAGFPQSITTQLGNTLTITGYNPATGVVSYSYTLNGNETHSAGDGVNNLSEQFSVVAGDGNGDTATGSLDINITDDVPKAVDDSNAGTATSANLTLEGNVLTNDVQGADRVATGPNAGPITAGTFTGTYGTLVLNANGTYTYTLNTSDADFKALHDGDSGTEKFTYTLTDADGDTSTATLELNIHNSPVTLNGLDVQGGELTVYEKNLTYGTDPNAPALTQNGTFTVTAPDGLQTLTIGGIAVVSSGVAAGFPQSADTGTGATFTITGYNPATGVVSYSYTLNYTDTHPNADGTNSISENFDVVATDKDGSTATGQINVNIVDDVPTAHADATSVAEGGTVTGNVLWNDVGGADGAGGAVVGVRVGSDTSTPVSGGLGSQINGTYGYLTLDAHGNAEYHSNPNAVNGPGATDVFTYTFRDADGDESTTTITIDVNNSSITAVSDNDVTVFEKALDLSKDGQDLAAGTVTGSQPGSTGETASGTLVGSVTGATGAITYTLVGNATGTYGQILLNPNGTYTYTLTSPASTTPHANDGANTLTETFTYHATDSLGNVVTSTIVVNIVDDVPKAVDDSNAATATSGNLTLEGNVLTNDVQGADHVATGPNSGPITAGTFTGTYGSLVLNANGTYTYTLNTSDADFKALHDGDSGTEKFTYTLTDADGDTSTATLELNIHNSPVTLNGLDVQGGELTVYEKNLTYGTDPNAPALTQNGTFTVTAPDGLQTLTVGGIAVVTGGVAAGFPQSTGGEHGAVFTITGYNPATGVVSYSYTLNYSDTHPNADGTNSISDNFNVVATDKDGSTATGQINVNIVDDTPTAHADATSVAEGGIVTGNVLWNDVGGADGPAAGGGVVGVRFGSDTSTPVSGGLGSQINGTYGYLTLDAAGNAVYHSNPNAVNGPGASDTFTYTLRDADGDESTTTVTIDVNNSCIKAVSDNDVTVFEKALDLSKDGQDLAAGTVTGSQPGSTGETASGTLVGSVTGATGAITYTLVGSATGTYGQILLNPNGTYTYTLTSPASTTPHANDGANTLSESFTYHATDSLGNVVTSTIVVNIVDDVPKAVNDNNASTATSGNLTLEGNVLTNDVQGADHVATGPNSGPITAGTFTGTYGTLILNANGTYTYTLSTSDADFKALHDGDSGTEKFTYTLTDADGDTSTATLELNIHNSPVTLNGLNVQGGELTVYEKNLTYGTDPNAPALTQNGTFTVTAPDGLQTLTVGGIAVVTGGVAAGFPQSTGGEHGAVFTITGYNPATGVVSYSYTLNYSDTHPNANGANSISDNFNVVATDKDGSTATGQINVNIVDDTPTAHADAISVGEGNVVTGNVLWNDVGGADGPAAGGGVVGVRFGSDTSTPVSGGLGTQINGTYGYLTLDAAGNAVYHSNPDSVSGPGASDTFTYTLRDADGDQSTTTITIDVTNSCIKAVPDTDATVFEKALDLSKDGQDLAAGTVTGSDPGHTGETATGTLVGSVTGASGAITYTLVGSATGTYGQILLNPNGTYTYTLTSAPKTSPGANDGANTLSESFTYKATDALGNSSTSIIKVDIVDDVPKAAASERSVTATEIDSNLLLVIDVSGSMADASGVPGVSRMEWAKTAINALLQKYDDLGDVKVQIVTFSTTATDKTSVWVDVATAKSIISGLTAGGNTNYDAAVTTMKAAFDTAGKLTGAQNVGYFFSDGKPTSGQEIGTADETALKGFLDANGIKNYAIGLGSGVSSANLNPLAYDGSNHTNTNAVVVTDLTQLNAVLSGTVVGAPVTGTLMEGGTFGADGGFIKTITVDGTTYTYDPKGNTNQGSLNFSGGLNHGTFNTVNNTLSIATDNKGTLVVNLDTGEYTYTSQKATAVVLTENIGFTVSDNDGDTASSNLVVKVNPNAAPVAGDDHVITNVLSGSVVVPGELLLANDTDANGDPLTAAPTTFTTGWVPKGADFVGTGAINFAATPDVAANRALADVRSLFAANTAAMTAVLVISGFLGAVTTANANDEDLITVKLKQGETLNLDHTLAAGHITMEYSLNGGAFVTIPDGGTITALADGTYQIHVTNITNTSGSSAAAEGYQLTMTVNYAGAHDLTPDTHSTYSANDNHGGSDSAGVTISYQDGHTLTGTSGDDVLVAGTGNNVINAGDGNDVLTAGSGNNELHGGAGNDLLFSGAGNDLLDGGTGNDTASYAHATAGVTADLSLLTAQNTFGAGTDTLTAIENLTGSNFNDSLTGDNNSNIINGGLGDDILKGGGGDDFLIGGLGNNTLTGGAGADTFQWLKGNSGHDVVTDFTPGTDKLDLSQLLQGENGTAASLDDYLHFKVTGSGASLVTSIDVSGMAGAAPNQTIDLAGVNLASHYGVTPGAGGVIAGGHDTATIINGMLNDHSLKVDTV